MDGCRHELSVLEAARGSCRRGLATSSNLDEFLVCRSWPTLETCSFEEKDGSERCRKRLRVRGEARACGGELHPTQRSPFDRASLCARPPCSMPVADSQPTYGSQCFRKGSWRVACRLPTSSCTVPSSTAGQRAPRAIISSGGADCGSRLLRRCACTSAVRVGVMEACGAGATDGITEPQTACLVAICGANDRA
jgi:hypothetical protein